MNIKHLFYTMNIAQFLGRLIPHHLFCRLIRQNELVISTQYNQFGSRYRTGVCKCCGRW